MTDSEAILSRLQRGAKYISDFARELPETPGVYRMLNDAGDVLYVGKAKRLKRRVLNYTKVTALPVRLQRMVSETVQLEVVHTHTEVEALLLESNLIKQLKPRYNILLRDDKSFPYLYLDTGHAFPRLDKVRGAKSGTGLYYGPFASTGAVNKTIAILQKAFLLRNCTDHNFATRSRPCLQYHIKRCTAPCVGYVSQEEYAEQIADIKPFLEGQSGKVKARLQNEMMRFSEAQDYERAAIYRDRIEAISKLQSQQDINVDSLGDVDVVVCVQKEGRSCVQVFFFRGGQNFGNRSYYPRHGEDQSEGEVLEMFLAQFYLAKPIPQQICLSHSLVEQEVLADALSEQSGQKIAFHVPQKGDRKRLIDFALQNAKAALQRYTTLQTKHADAFRALVDLFDLDDVPSRVEIYDNSHVSGTNMVGAMVVAGIEGFQKSAYRKFNIKAAKASDDYGMMREVMSRRFRDVDPDDAQFPDLLLIDGGRGQLSAVRDVLVEKGLFEHLCVVAISKGPDRNAGREEFHIEGRKTFSLPVDDMVLFILQNLRDEAHRFAVESHRKHRQKSALRSSIDLVEGIGPKKKKALLHHFGSAEAVKNAGIDDLKLVSGISSKIAEKIYYTFHEDT